MHTSFTFIHLHNIAVNALVHSTDCGGCRLVCPLGYFLEFGCYYQNFVEFDQYCQDLG